MPMVTMAPLAAVTVATTLRRFFFRLCLLIFGCPSGLPRLPTLFFFMAGSAGAFAGPPSFMRVTMAVRMTSR
jgi:hypothetical protein